MEEYDIIPSMRKSHYKSVSNVYQIIVNNEAVAEIGATKEGLGIYGYVLPKYRRKGYYAQVVKKMMLDNNQLEFWIDDPLKDWFIKHPSWKCKAVYNRLKCNYKKK